MFSHRGRLVLKIEPNPEIKRERLIYLAIGIIFGIEPILAYSIAFSLSVKTIQLYLMSIVIYSIFVSIIILSFTQYLALSDFRIYENGMAYPFYDYLIYRDKSGKTNLIRPKMQLFRRRFIPFSDIKMVLLYLQSPERVQNSRSIYGIIYDKKDPEIIRYYNSRRSTSNLIIFDSKKHSSFNINNLWGLRIITSKEIVTLSKQDLDGINLNVIIDHINRFYAKNDHLNVDNKQSAYVKNEEKCEEPYGEPQENVLKRSESVETINCKKSNKVDLFNILLIFSLLILLISGVITLVWYALVNKMQFKYLLLFLILLSISTFPLAIFFIRLVNPIIAGR